MGSHVIILVAIGICLTMLRPPLLGGLSAPGPWVWPLLVLYVGIGAGLAILACRAGLRGAEGDVRQFRRHQRLTAVGQLYLLGGLAVVLDAGYARWIIESAGLWRVPLADEAAGLAPFLVALVLGWLLTYPCFLRQRLRILEREMQAGRITRPPWTLREYLDYNTRHQLLFILVPVGLILLGSDLLELLLAPHLSEGTAEVVISAGSAVVAGIVFLMTPLLVARIWRTRPLEDGPLRQGLMQMCRRMGVGSRDILVWLTGGMIANAAVMGLLAPLRYVLISDMVLEHLDRRQVESVFAHEATHISQRHILYSLLFAFASAVLTMAAAAGVAFVLHLGEHVEQSLSLALLVLAWAFGYGWISRRLERQSDVWSAWAMSDDPVAVQQKLITLEGAILFATSLQRIAHLSGLQPNQRNWRHGSVASRCQHVLSLGTMGDSRSRVDRTVKRIKIGLWAASAAAIALLVI